MGEMQGLEAPFREPAVWELPDEPPFVEVVLTEAEVLGQIEFDERGIRRAVAGQYVAVVEVFARAQADPTVWCGPDPTLDPEYRDPRGRTTGRVRAEWREFAVRAACLDIATRLRVSEQVVRARHHTAVTLQERCPTVWAAFRDGAVSEQNARTAADAAGTLPADAVDAWAVFDTAVARSAEVLTAGKFRTRARVVRERVHAESLEVRHVRAVAERTVWVAAEYDGMATFSMRVAAEKATAVMRVVDTTARHLHTIDGETRTLAQLRADVACDLLTTTPDHRVAVKASVAVTIPALTLLGHGTEPATLDGYGPIPIDTAKHLAGTATSWVRILTHPVTGTILDVDRKTYRVTTDLHRWLGIVHKTCGQPGCARPARDCDIDHRIEWQHGGTTTATNLTPLCEPHHQIKTETHWTYHRQPDGTLTFTSPTGHTTNPDPHPSNPPPPTGPCETVRREHPRRGLRRPCRGCASSPARRGGRRARRFPCTRDVPRRQ
jgi:hypothetical protein